MRSTIVCLTLFITLLLSIACKKSNTTSTNATALEGTWTTTVGTWGFSLLVNTDRTYICKEGNNEIETGNYTVSNTNISFITATSTIQFTGQNGLYNYDINDKTLKFAKVYDSCTYRSTFMSYTWTKQ